MGCGRMSTENAGVAVGALTGFAAEVSETDFNSHKSKYGKIDFCKK